MSLPLFPVLAIRAGPSDPSWAQSKQSMDKHRKEARKRRWATIPRDGDGWMQDGRYEVSEDGRLRVGGWMMPLDCPLYPKAVVVLIQPDNTTVEVPFELWAREVFRQFHITLH